MPDIVSGAIAERWHALGGVLGKPIAHPEPLRGGHGFSAANGHYQAFEHGNIAWTPDQGPKMTVAAYQQDRQAVFAWGPTDPFHYDRFIVRWCLTTSAIPDPPDRWAQNDVEVDGRRTFGWYGPLSPPSDIGSSEGFRFFFIVEGYDNNGSSRQGWTYPVTVRVR
ncbi:hypothetical protein [Streptomyces sp. 8N706]|uniref:hypothetical protein n=1 Tax=Streptomyces sp. 8N706 TaxID=3457416 RepID=UPI003FD3E9BA